MIGTQQKFPSEMYKQQIKPLLEKFKDEERLITLEEYFERYFSRCMEDKSLTQKFQRNMIRMALTPVEIGGSLLTLGKYINCVEVYYTTQNLPQNVAKDELYEDLQDLLKDWENVSKDRQEQLRTRQILLYYTNINVSVIMTPAENFLYSKASVPARFYIDCLSKLFYQMQNSLMQYLNPITGPFGYVLKNVENSNNRSLPLVLINDPQNLAEFFFSALKKRKISNFCLCDSLLTIWHKKSYIKKIATFDFVYIVSYFLKHDPPLKLDGWKEILENLSKKPTSILPNDLSFKTYGEFWFSNYSNVEFKVIIPASNAINHTRENIFEGKPRKFY